MSARAEKECVELGRDNSLSVPGLCVMSTYWLSSAQERQTANSGAGLQEVIGRRGTLLTGHGDRRGQQ